MERENLCQSIWNMEIRKISVFQFGNRKMLESKLMKGRPAFLNSGGKQVTCQHIFQWEVNNPNGLAKSKRVSLREHGLPLLPPQLWPVYPFPIPPHSTFQDTFFFGFFFSFLTFWTKTVDRLLISFLPNATFISLVEKTHFIKRSSSISHS